MIYQKEKCMTVTIDVGAFWITLRTPSEQNWNKRAMRHVSFKYEDNIMNEFFLQQQYGFRPYNSQLHIFQKDGKLQYHKDTYE
jgi:hypothetical protein